MRDPIYPAGCFLHWWKNIAARRGTVEKIPHPFILFLYFI